MRRNKFEEFLYDFFGGIFIIVIVLVTIFSCSDTARSFAIDQYNNFTTKEVKTDSIKTPKDSVTIIKKTPTTPHIDASTETENTHADTVQLVRKDDKLYYLPIKVNGIPMKFTLDTGCSDMSMSIVEYYFLERQGLVNDKNAQECISVLANGEEEKGFSVILKDVTIGNKTIHNIRCGVSPNQDAALLLGQDILSKLGDVTIKYNKNILIIE